MTMQIGMVGTDGIVLASDQKWTQEYEDIRQSWGASKIGLDKTGNVAIGCAKDMRKSVAIARSILAELDSSHWENPISKIEEIANGKLSRHSPFEAECLIGMAYPTPRGLGIGGYLRQHQTLLRAPGADHVQGRLAAGPIK
jgi:20S proteasome alpha/beta subunit